MKDLKRLFLFVMMSVLAVFFLTGCSSKEDIKGQLEVKVELGYDSTVKVGSHNPLVAYVQNKGPAFSGELQIEVEDNMNGKVMIATPFEMAENSQKEIQLEVPVLIIQKNFTVSIASGKDLYYKEKIKTRKVLSPNQQVIAIITDTPDVYRFLDGTKTGIVAQDPYMDKMAATQVYQAEITEELQVQFFDSFDALNSTEKLNYFNYVYIGHNQSLTISEEVEAAIIEWIKSGKHLIIETGADYKKMNSILPSSLNPMAIDETQNVKLTNILSGIAFDQNIDVAISSTIDQADFVYQQEGEAAIGAVTKVGNGSILTLLVNMGLEPLASWNAKAPFMSGIIQESNVQMNYMDMQRYGSPYQYLLSQVPIEKKTPYVMILIIFSLYILLIAPVSYFILKKLDKRDFAWIGIPIMAILCIATLYIFGGNTRYTKAIANSVSILTADESSDVMQIKTEINVFNNNKDNLTIEWDPSEQININYGQQQDMYYGGGYYGDPNSKVEKQLTGKLTIGSPMKYEKYNAPLWAASYITAEKQIPFNNDEKMVRVKIDGSELIITAKNTTPYTLLNAFIQWGQGFIFIGDLEPGEEKQVTKDFDAFQQAPFETFIQTEMGIKPFDYVNKPTATDMAAQRKFEILMQRYVYNNHYGPQSMNMQSGFDIMKICAMNNQQVGYDFKVNGDITEDYSTNIIEISTVLALEKGEQINIPAGIIIPETFYYLNEDLTLTGNFDYQAYDQYLRFYEQGIVEFYYNIPKTIELESAHLELGDIYHEQDYYNVQNGVAATSITGITYSVYNVEEEVWETIGKKMDLDQKYVDIEGNIKVTVDMRTQDQKTSGMKDNYYVQMMKLPTLSIEGSVK